MLEDMLLDYANARTADDAKRALNRLARVGVDAMTAKILVQELPDQRNRVRESCSR